jgi:4,5-DOPA dioxygenase extradiol
MSDGERKIGRRGLIELAGVSLVGAALAGCERAVSQAHTQPKKKDKAMSSRMPVLFVGHGSPMNAVLDNAWSRGFAELGGAIPKPKAILAVSAHWYVPGTFLTSNAQPKTIHDFGGFPSELYEIQYPASGNEDLAKRVSGLLTAQSAALHDDWGLDHGTWQVLRHTYPKADVPVVQLSIDHRLPPAQHVAIGKALAPLREEGVLIFGSGNIVHNLRHAIRGLSTGSTEIPPWAEAFDAHIASALEQHDNAFLANALSDETGRMSHPSPDHYFPLLYTAGAASDADKVTFPITGFDSSISMRAVRWG